jgi:hypothetical protein
MLSSNFVGKKMPDLYATRISITVGMKADEESKIVTTAYSSCRI